MEDGGVGDERFTEFECVEQLPKSRVRRPKTQLSQESLIGRKYVLLAEVRKHSGRTTLRVRIDQAGSQIVNVLDRAACAAPL